MNNVIEKLAQISNECDSHRQYKLADSIDNLSKYFLFLEKKMSTWKFASTNKKELTHIYASEYLKGLFEAMMVAERASKQGNQKVASMLTSAIDDLIKYAQGQPGGLWNGIKNIGRGIKRFFGDTYEQALHGVEKLIGNIQNGQIKNPQDATAALNNLVNWFNTEAARTQDKGFYALARNFIQTVQAWNKQDPKQLIPILQQAITNIKQVEMQAQQAQQGQQGQDPNVQNAIQQYGQMVVQILSRKDDDPTKQNLMKILGLETQAPAAGAAPAAPAAPVAATPAVAGANLLTD